MDKSKYLKFKSKSQLQSMLREININYIIYMITLILFSYQNLIKYNCQNIHYSEFAQQIEIPTRSKFKTVKVN